ncbi:MAG: class I SAM-dependent methyltransferase [Pseudomonadota bacterium]
MSAQAAMKTSVAGATASKHFCRFCESELTQQVVDLGMQPLCESYVAREALDSMEPTYPVKAYVCSSCYLVQVLDFVSGEEIYSHYAYFSSFSESWLKHVDDYVGNMVERFGIDANSQVIEIASNDGYLLQYVKARGIPALGIEPAENIAEYARSKGIETIARFFGSECARDLTEEGRKANLLIANNVFGHVPDINDFVAGMKIALADDGVLTVEIPHVAKTIKGNQFDQFYQEHFSYYSLLSAQKIFEAHDLIVFDVDELPTHGGSLRYYVKHADCQTHKVSNSVDRVKSQEIADGFDQMQTYQAFSDRAKEIKRALLEFLIDKKRAGESVVGYGAPGKGGTLLNYCGIREDFLDYTVDRSDFKQGKFMPGSHIPIHSPDVIAKTRPDYILILPWNLREEITDQLAYVREWGCKFVVPIPHLDVF